MKTERNYKSIVIQFVAIVLALVIVVTTTQVIAYADQSPVGCIAYVTAETKLNLREKPQGLIISEIRNGETVTILSERDRDGYYYVRVNSTGKEYYAYGEFLRIEYGTQYQEPYYPVVQITPAPFIPPVSEEIEENNQYSEWENRILVVISEKKLNMRKRSNRKGDRIKYLEYGDRLQVVKPEIKNGYILVRDLNEGKVGYVDIDYVVFESNFSDPLTRCDCCPDCPCFR